MRMGKDTSGARQCGIGSPFDPIMHAAGCKLPQNACILWDYKNVPDKSYVRDVLTALLSDLVHGDLLAVLAHALELHLAVHQGEQGVV